MNWKQKDPLQSEQIKHEKTTQKELKPNPWGNISQPRKSVLFFLADSYSPGRWYRSLFKDLAFRQKQKDIAQYTRKAGLGPLVRPQVD